MASPRYEALKSLDAQLKTVVLIAVQEIVKAYVEELTNDLAKEIEVQLKKISSSFTGFRAYQQEANEEIAEEMRVAVLEAYDAKREEMRAHRNAPPEYRVGNSGYGDSPGRIGGSALRQALSGEGVAKASYQGIAFLNTSILNQQAAFWRRLNFGSGGGFAVLPGLSFTVLGQHMETPYFSTQKGAPNTARPGLWFTASGDVATRSNWSRSDTFAPLERLGTEKYRVHDIQAWDFLDAGIERFNQVAGPVYERMVQRIINRGLKS